MRSPTRALARLERFVREWPHGGAVVGGLAVIARVRARTTVDADLVIVAPPPPDALLAHATSAGYGYDATDIGEWFEGGVVRLRAEEGDLDLIIADDPFLADVVERATEARFGNARLPVATTEDLLLLKLASGRPIDLDDALAIKDAFSETLDRDYLLRQGERLAIDVLRFLDSDR